LVGRDEICAVWVFRLVPRNRRKGGDHGKPKRETSLCGGSVRSRDNCVDRIGKRPGVWARILGDHVGGRARRQWWIGAGSGCYSEAYRERANAHGNYERNRQLSYACASGRRI